MKRAYSAILVLVSLLVLAVAMGFTKKESEVNAVEPVTSSVKISKTETIQTGSKSTISYKLDKERPILHLTSPQIKDVDVGSLQKEIGDDNVGIDDEHQQIHLNLKNKVDENGEGSFTLVTNSPEQVIMGFSDINEEQLLVTMLNPEGSNSYAEGKISDGNEEEIAGDNNDDGVDEDPNIYENEDDPTKGWTRTNRMMISPGHVKTNPDGSKTYPVIYFGAINYALQGITIEDAVAGRPLSTGVAGLLGRVPIGTGRKDNVTAANTSIIEVPKNGKMTDLQTNKKSESNKFYTNTFGDGMLPPPGFGPNIVSAGDKKYRGSQRNFVTTNLFNYYKKPMPKEYPKIFGPDEKNIGDYTGLVKKQTRLYYKLYKDPESDEETIMQRLIFYQKMGDYQIRVKITQRFDENNGVIINHEFFNVGSKYIDSFQGYVFRDVTFMKNHKMDPKEQDNPIRSLGDHQGVYSYSEKYGQRVEMKFDGFEDDPYAWSSSGTRSAYYKASKKDHFPWNYNGAIKKQDAFTSINDLGDKKTEPGRGNTWVNEKYTYDSGVSMHTKDQPLAPGEKVTMSYAVNALQVKFEPELEIHNAAKKSMPHELKPEDESFKVDGEWRSAHNRYVKVKYLVRPAEDFFENDKDKEELLEHGIDVSKDFQKQSDHDKNSGIPQNWSTEISLDQLQAGINEVYAIAIDKEGLTSEIRRTYVNLPERDYPVFIQVNTPSDGTNINNPYEPRTDKEFIDKLDISGVSFSTSGIYEISYFVDGVLIKKPLEMGDGSEPNAPNFWTLPGFSLKPYLKNTDTHTIPFVIKSTEKDVHGKDIIKYAAPNFYFRMKPKELPDGGRFEIIAPDKIDFGTLNLASNSEKDARPTVKGNLFVDDYREPDKKANPVHVTLAHESFVKKAGDETEVLKTELLWDNYKVDSTRSYDIKPDDVTNRTVLTDVLKEKLHLKVKRDQGTTDGQFKSKFYWNATDSL
ncbi:hypothetical protein [Companilactobacillus furfuricola]|uniref:hypothetical protein n=1 Tax=Companilactobacillus furfuricola TaxID=1462575 RepID=UPI000F7B6025|nr:hypothetical protein [Companilactobacillus furfuricola]